MARAVKCDPSALDSARATLPLFTHFTGARRISNAFVTIMSPPVRSTRPRVALFKEPVRQ